MRSARRMGNAVRAEPREKAGGVARQGGGKNPGLQCGDVTTGSLGGERTYGRKLPHQHAGPRESNPLARPYGSPGGAEIQLRQSACLWGSP